MNPGSSARLRIKVIPNAPRSEICGWLGPDLKIKVHAPPVAGRANDELCRFLAGALEVPLRSIRVTAGAASRQKTIEIQGLTLDLIKQRLNLG